MMNANSRFVDLMSRMLDDVITDAELVELHERIQADPSLRSRLVDHLVLDTLLEESLGQESLATLIDLVGDSSEEVNPITGNGRHTPARLTSSPRLKRSRWPRRSGWLVVAASLVAVVSLALFQGDREVHAHAFQLVEAAMHTHAGPIERIYVVEVDRSDSPSNRVELPRDVRVATQGDRFWVQMRGFREWAWGRDGQGAVWMTLGSKRAVVVTPDEMGAPLRYIGDLYTLHLETLLQNFLKHCRLEMLDGPANSTIIVATPRRQWSKRPLQRATIEVDRETKAIRKLVIEREFESSSSISTFTLVDSRLADESLYGPEGHLFAPFRIFAKETKTKRRHELITNWFGPTSEQWMKIAEPASNE